ncbi:putative rhamnosyl transferase [Ruegeria pomeroyi]|nr:putative rhamnosyl transferase [Ruegeria pomeroyi]MCE8531008.1 putative rhamnosyl transferase [Ruegeria pomeroyi]MCE8547787.1 putative rhamnosyl transferase [Ruegeria pomeroyi]
MQVLGLCRFSYLGHGGFKVMHETLDERRAYLYAPARMEDRFRQFEAITLPSVAGQTDPDFEFLVVIGECFPDSYRARLEGLVRDVPQVRIRAYPPLRHRTAMAQALDDHRHDIDAPCLQFRLDDDDGMARDFVARYREVAADTEALWRKHPAVAVDFNTGYVFRCGQRGIEVSPFQFAYSAIALGVIVAPGHREGIMHFGHHKLWTVMPTITVPGEDMLLRGHNDFNDSRAKPGAKQFRYQPLDADEEAYFKARFNIDNARVREIFSAPPP